MTIMTTNAAPLRFEAIQDGVNELTAVAWQARSETQGLARMGVATSVTLSSQDKITVDMNFGAETAHLLPGFVAGIANTALTRTDTGFTVAGTAFHGAINIKATVAYAAISVVDAEALVAAVDTDLDDEVSVIDSTVLL